MRKFFVLLPALLLLGSCNQQEYTEKNAKVDYVADLGVIDNCRVKYVQMSWVPSFFIARCGNTTSTYYDTGGKSPTRAGFSLKESD